jgi:uncharacterized protein YjdB/PKD repeat protein
LPANATDKSVSWVSSDTSIATVSPSGEVRAVSVGSATITATANDGSGVYATCMVTVSGGGSGQATGISLPREISLSVGDTAAVQYSFLPSGALPVRLSWSVENIEVAEIIKDVFQAGDFFLLAKNAGTTFLYATSDDGKINDKVKVTVSEEPAVADRQRPFNGFPSAIPGLIMMADFDERIAPGAAYFDTTPENEGGDYRDTEVDIEICNLGGFNIGWVETGEWLEYTVDVKQSGLYNAVFIVASSSPVGSFRLLLDGKIIEDNIAVSTARSTGWQDWQPLLVEDINLTAGKSILKWEVQEGGFNIYSMDWELKSTVTDPVVGNFQYASKVFGYSTQFGEDYWSAQQALGAPNVPYYSDHGNAWASSSTGSSREFLELGFSRPDTINTIKIWETFNPGAIDTVYVFNPEIGNWEIVWSGTAYPEAPRIRVFEVKFPTTSFFVDRVRIAINSPAVPGWNEIDAVAIGNSEAAPSNDGYIVIDDCEDGNNINFLGGGWFTFDDSGALTNGTLTPGASAVSPSIGNNSGGGANGSNYSARIDYSLDRGELMHDPFVGLGTTLSIDNRQGLNVSGSTGISFWYKSSHPVIVQTSSIIDGEHIVGFHGFEDLAPAPVWTKVILSWEQFKQPSWALPKIALNLSELNEFVFLVQTRHGSEGSLQIDDLRIEGISPIGGKLEMPSEITGIAVGEETTIDVLFSPADLTYKELEWLSSDESVAVVSPEGFVTGLSKGSAEIKARLKHIDSVFYTAQVAVSGEANGLDSLKFTVSELEMQVGQNAAIDYAAYTKDNFQRLVWESSDVTVADVNSTTGLVKAQSPGVALITARCFYNPSVSDTLMLTVIRSEGGGDDDDYEESLLIYPSNFTPRVGENVRMKLAVSENGGLIFYDDLVEMEYIDASELAFFYQALKWTSSDTRVASVNNGIVSVKSYGSANISACITDEYGAVAYCAEYNLYIPREGETLLVLGNLRSAVGTFASLGNQQVYFAREAPEFSYAIDIAYSLSGLGNSHPLSNGRVISSTTDPLINSIMAGTMSMFEYKRETLFEKIEGVSWDNITDNIILEAADNARITYAEMLSPGDIYAVRTQDGGSYVFLVAEVTGRKSLFDISLPEAGEISIVVRRAMQEEIPAQGLSLSHASISMDAGTVFAGLSATVLPYNASNRTVIWETSDSSVVTIDRQSGIISTKTTGSAVVTARLASDPRIFRNCFVTVSEAVADNSDLADGIIEASMLLASIEMDNIGNEEGQYSEDAYKALLETIAAANEIFADRFATQIQIDSANNALAEAVQELRSSKKGAILAEEITLNAPSVQLNGIGASQIIRATVLPANAANKGLVWMSSNPGAVRVSSSGTVTAISAGSSVITARAADGSGVTASCIVSVNVPVESINIPLQISLEKGNSRQIYANISPVGAEAGNITWRSTNDSVASVDRNGNITALSAGSALVIASVGSVSAICVVNVSLANIAATGVSISNPVKNIAAGNSYTFAAQLVPSNSTAIISEWISSNPDVIVIDSASGIAFAAGVGTAKVTVVVEGGATDEVEVEVLPSGLPYLEKPLPELVLPVGTERAFIVLSDYLRDDNTAFSDFEISTSGGRLYTEVENDTLWIEIDAGWLGNETITIEVKDADGQISEFNLSLLVSDIPNRAPELAYIPSQAVAPGQFFLPIDLKLYVNDDYTAATDIRWEVEPGMHTVASVLRDVLHVSPNKSAMFADSVKITAIDASGESSYSYIKYSVSDSENTAPVAAEIPAVVQTDEAPFPVLQLWRYVTDDYTMPLDIRWEVISISTRVSVAIRNGEARFTAIDHSWLGSEQISLRATDHHGLSTDVSVSVRQRARPKADWNGAPMVDLFAQRTRIGVGTAARFSASISGGYNAFLWEFDGGNPATVDSQTDPDIVYNSVGEYSVSFSAQNTHGTSTVSKDAYINVVGIIADKTEACPGDVVKLRFSDNTLSAYTWNTGQTGIEIELTIENDTAISVVAEQGLLRFRDTVFIKAGKKPVLGNELRICYGDTAKFDMPGYVSYAWNGNAGTEYFETTDAGMIELLAEDNFGCVYEDSLELIVNQRPVLSLPPNDTICQGLDFVIGAGVHDSYKWNTGQNTPTITVSEKGEYSVTVTNAGTGCQSSAAFHLEVQTPYAEQLGVATFSQDGATIILAWNRTPGMRTVRYELMQEKATGANYEAIASLEFNQESYYWDDASVASAAAYRYKLRSYDNCGNYADSEPHRTIHVSTSPSSSVQNGVNIGWNRYEGLPIGAYKIERTNPDGTTQPEYTQPASAELSFTYTAANVEPGTKFRVIYDLPETINPSKLKSDSGPFSQSLSNIAEAVLGTETPAADMCSPMLVPNPASGSVAVLLCGTGAEYSVKLIDPLGREVAEASTAQLGLMLDISHLPAGIYTVVVSGAEAVSVQKLSIEN